MSEFKPITISQLKDAIKDLSDDMPIYLDDEHDCMALLSINQRTLTDWEYIEDEDNETSIEALVLGVA